MAELASESIDQPDRSVLRVGGDPRLAVGRCDCRDVPCRIARLRTHAELLARGPLPGTYCVVGTRRHHIVALEPDRQDGRLVPLRWRLVLPCRGVNQADGVAFAGQGHQLAVRRNGHLGAGGHPANSLDNFSWSTLRFEQLLAGFSLPGDYPIA